MAACRADAGCRSGDRAAYRRESRRSRRIERTGRGILPDSRRFEAGSLNTNGVYGLRASLDLLLETGIERIAEYVVALATRFAK